MGEMPSLEGEEGYPYAPGVPAHSKRLKLDEF